MNLEVVARGGEWVKIVDTCQYDLKKRKNFRVGGIATYHTKVRFGGDCLLPAFPTRTMPATDAD